MMDGVRRFSGKASSLEGLGFQAYGCLASPHFLVGCSNVASVMMRFSTLSRSRLRWVIVSVLSCLLVLNTVPYSLAQLAPFSTPSSDSQKVLGWNPNRAYTCGRLLCSNVFLPGTIGSSFTLAKNIALGDPRGEVETAVEDRAKQVESIVASIRETILSRKREEGMPPLQRDRRWYRDRVFHQLDGTLDPDLHPDTPVVGVGPENNQLVVFIPAQPEKGLAQQTIVTVTELDLIHAGIPRSIANAIRHQTTAQSPSVTSASSSASLDSLNTNDRNQTDPNGNEETRIISPAIEALAQKWNHIIRNNLSDALWGQAYEQQYPLDRMGLAVGLVGITAGLIWLLNLFQKLFRAWRRRLRKRNQTIKQLLIENRELATTEGPLKQDEDGKKEDSEIDQKTKSSMAAEQLKTLNIKSPPLASTQPTKVTAIAIEELKSNPLGAIFDFDHVVIDQFQNLVQRVSLDEQSRNRQLRNLLQLLLRSLFWLQVTVLFTGVTLIALVFPGTRLYSIFFISQAILLPTIWMAISLLDIVVDFVSDRYLHQWAKSAQLDDPSSNRYALRVNTYSPAIQGATTMMFVALGVYFTVLAFGINPSVLASAGAAAVVVAFLSRNLLEDMLNGALILWTDRYAIGDVIQVGAVTGFVENMNLYITQIRGAEGRLVTIPNGRIGIVENLTKDWSRVDFKIEIAHNADVAKALDVIQQVSEQMRQESPWSDCILEPASILGVDAVSHAGILIQVWIKTQPIQQFAVGREFRLRIKQAFDEAGIDLGVPQQEISYHKRNKLPIH